MTEHSVQTLKSGGFVELRGQDRWAVRVRLRFGDASAAQLHAVAEIAERFGDGEVHVTVRQGLEVRGVRAEDFEAVRAVIAEAGLETASCGARVRAPVSCPGSAVCRRGLNDTRVMAEAIDERLFGREDLPHKFKTAVTGCNSACAKPQANDLGFMGTVRSGERGWRVFIGGKFGKRAALGYEVASFVSDEEAVRIAERAVDAYARLGEGRERLRDTIDRVGLETFLGEVL